MDINVKYFDSNMKELVKNEEGDWIDLSVVNACVCDNIEAEIDEVLKYRSKDTWSEDGKMWFDKGEVIVMRLGVAIELPKTKKAQVIPRSSTFKNYGLLLVNSVGAIDNKYQGDNDEWLAVFYATRVGCISQYDRVVQFDIVDRMNVNIHKVDKLGEVDRGGHGTSGKQ